MTTSDRDIGIIGIVVGGASLVGVLLLSMIVLLLWCRLRKTRGDLLNYSKSGISQENVYVCA